MRPANFAPRGNNRETNVLDCCVWPLCVKSLTIFKRPICGGPAMNFRISFARISLAHSSASRTKIQSPVACASAKLRAAAKSLVQAKCATCAPFSLAILTVSSVEPVSVTMISSAMARTLRRQRAKQRASFLAIMASDNFISAIHRERLHERLDAVVVQTFFDVGGVEALAFGNEQQAAGRVDAARENHAGTQFAEGNLPFAARHGGDGLGAQKNFQRLGIEGDADAGFYSFNGVGVSEPAGGEGDGHGERRASNGMFSPTSWSG